MNNIERRNFLKKMAGGLGCAIIAPVVETGKAFASKIKARRDSDVGLLYDATKCIGCKACEVACKKANNMPAEPGPGGIWDEARDLTSKTLNIIKLYKEKGKHSFIKRQCLHCVDPECVSACPTGAMAKLDNGVVVWRSDACVGCRYCQMACPFNTPKYEFESQYGRIIKCELCSNNGLLASGTTACADICPTRAVIFGKTKKLLAIARKRLADHPERYNGKIYGERDNGGTNVIYLAAVPFEKLGLPHLPEYSAAKVSEGIQHTLYNHFIAPIAIYAGLVCLAFKNIRGKNENKGE